VETLLTLKQVQEILSVDRTTIHRMLKDGRLNGVKVGGQWRFSPQEIEALTRGATRKEEGWGEDVLPLFCIQRMQDVFAELAGIGAVVTDLQGTPLTGMSNSCEFCTLMLSSPSGQAACQNSWREMTVRQGEPARFHKCHAGLQYSRAVIEVEGRPVATIVSGQFHLETPDDEQRMLSAQQLAEAHHLPFEALHQAAQKLPVLSEKYQGQIGTWLDKVAGTFSDLTNERVWLLRRLHQIAEITLDVEEGTLSKLTR
jgi:excisionase family DNA binding protein